MRQMTVVAVAAIAALAASAGLAGCASSSSSSGAGAGAGATSSASASTASCTFAGVQNELYAKGVLTVATDKPAYPPWFINNKPSNGQGYESAVAYAVAAQLGFKPSQVTWAYEPFDSSYAPGPKKFDFDINEISYSAQRAHGHVVELAEDRPAALGDRVEGGELVANREEPVQRRGAPPPQQRHALDRVVRAPPAHPVPVEEHQGHPRLRPNRIVCRYYPHEGEFDPR